MGESFLLPVSTPTAFEDKRKPPRLLHGVRTRNSPSTGDATNPDLYMSENSKHAQPRLIATLPLAVPPVSQPRLLPDLATSRDESSDYFSQDSFFNPVPPSAGATKLYRDGSVNRGRGGTPTALRAASPRAQVPGQDVGLERKPSLSYGHHRNTSIVHGVQHSRNTSFTSPLASPLSPAMIASAGTNGHSMDSMTMSPDSSTDMSPTSIFTASTTNGSFRSMTSVSTNNGATPTSEKASLDGTLNSGTAVRRPERMHSSRTRRGHEHHRSSSRQSRHPHPHTTERKTVGEYAIHHLFNSFISYANQKIDQCTYTAGQPEPRIESICGPGADPAFDQLISALGHISRQKPKPLIDTLMFWRKAKSEAATQARAELGKERETTPPTSLPRRNTEQVVRSVSRLEDERGHGQTSSAQQRLDQLERHSQVSVYLLCRVLMEIFRQSTLECLGQDCAERLEEIIYSQLNSYSAQALELSALKRANWDLFAQLLAVMANLNFDSVTNRFLRDLDSFHRKLDQKGVGNIMDESKAALLVQGMSYIKLKLPSSSGWDRTCQLVRSLARLFTAVHGQNIKNSYCRLLERLLLPVAGKSSSERNTPAWREVIESLRPKTLQLLSKQKHWAVAFPLMSVVLCVAPPDIFASQSLPLIMSVQSKLKDRDLRPIALKGVCRLVWTYIYRSKSDTQVAVVRNLMEIIRMIFHSSKRPFLSTEPHIAEPLIQLIRIIGYEYQDVCFRHIIFPLMNSDQFLTGKDPRSEALVPERMVIAIRAFLILMADLEARDKPPFPLTFDDEPSKIDPFAHSPLLTPRGNSFSAHDVPASMTNSAHNGDRLSKPVITTNFDHSTKEAYAKFCKILGEITIICDNAFGGQAVLEERYFGQTPKTPMAEAFSFTRRDDHQGPADPRQSFYDLLHVAVQALPRCLSPYIPFNSLVNLLCTGTAHVQSNIAASSAQSLKSIARQSHAQQVTVGFARFIFNFDDRFSTMSDGGMLGPDHIENTLRLYVELLQIWIDDIKQKTRKTGHESPGDTKTRGVQLDLSGISAHVDEIESHGLFFLCSPSKLVRAYAITVLRCVVEFDTALGVKDSTRIISIIEGSPSAVLDVNDSKLSLAERSRLQRGMRKSNIQSTLVELCSSDAPYDLTLWYKLFPNLIRISSGICFNAVTLTRDIVCARLSQMNKTLQYVADASRATGGPSFDVGLSRLVGRMSSTPPEVIIEQWKLYMIFASTTMTNLGTPSRTDGTSAQHGRKSSKSSQHNGDKVDSAKELFHQIIPFLSTDHEPVRDAVVAALGSINANLYLTLLESLQRPVEACNEEAKARLAVHQRTASGSQAQLAHNTLRTEIAHVYKLTAHFLQCSEVQRNNKFDWMLNNVSTYTKDLRLFLNDDDVQEIWNFHKLRTHYCGLVEELFESLIKQGDTMRWMPFQSRKATFQLMEEWCGYAPHRTQVKQREENMRRSVLLQEQAIGNKGYARAAYEIEKRDLRNAALSAMASLCGGPLTILTDSKVKMTFDVSRILSWIEAIFNTPSDRIHAIGRRALKNLILHNPQHPYLLRQAIHMCYNSNSLKALGSYFEVVTEILTEDKTSAIGFWSVACVGLYTLGSEHSDIRMKSARLLRALQERQQGHSRLQDLDISVSDKTIAVYKHAQSEVSRRLANQHSDLAFHVFAEFASYFSALEPDHKRNMVSAMLPWVQILHLQLDPNGGPTAEAYMVLVNLFEITVHCGNALHNEVRSLWQALATGPHGNVQLIMDFIISLCLDKKEHHFVDYAKQIVVFLSSTPAGVKVIDYLLLQLSPKSMVIQDSLHPMREPPGLEALPYHANLDNILPLGRTQNGFSLCQVCLILLVDLVVSPVQLPSEHVPLLLQVCLGLWDHHTPMVQDQSREMVVHLIHELVISKVEDHRMGPRKLATENLIDMIRQSDPRIAWSYHECDGKGDIDVGNKVPEAMVFLTEELIEVFSIQYPNIKEDWSRLTLKWATSCAVRHVACRSFQIFRCLLTSIDKSMLADMLARLSNTVAHDESEYLSFSTEILATLEAVVDAFTSDDLLRHPQLFWATCACLETIHEREYLVCLSMLNKLVSRLDLSSPRVVATLRDSIPRNWEGQFEGLQTLVYKGLKSSASLDLSLKILGQLVILPSNDLIGHNNGLLFTVLANIPRYLRTFSNSAPDVTGCISSANAVASVAGAHGYDSLSTALHNFSQRRYRSEQDFLASIINAIRTSYFPLQEFDSLVFLMGLLTNKSPWFKSKVLQVLGVVLPGIDMRKPEISNQGPDLISPLLRLLQTGYCLQALQCLDHVLYMTGTPLDKHHLRMSMVGFNSSAAVRKQYEKVQSLYGIPEETGWSIPMPALHSNNTIRNVLAVFYTCQTTGTASGEDVPTPEIPFHKEEPNNGSYFPRMDKGVTIDTILPPQPHESVEKLLAGMIRLRNIINGIDNDQPPRDPQKRERFPQYGGPQETHENVYEQQTLPILHKSLTNNTSVTSFQNGFSDFKNPTIRTDTVMTPTAFTPSPASANTLNSAGGNNQNSNLSVARPTLGSRAVTSPPTVTQQHIRGAPSSTNTTNLSFSSSTEPYSGDEGTGDEQFSDDDALLSRANTHSTAPSLYSINTSSANSSFHNHVGSNGLGSLSTPTIPNLNTPTNSNGFLDKVGRPLQSTKSGFRSGMRRLTGASAGERSERERHLAMKMAGHQHSHGAVGTPAMPTPPQGYVGYGGPGGRGGVGVGGGLGALRSPSVPKVPDVWLQNPKSSDL
ncbi:MAG: Cell morphogenesis protein PAG1 [Bogoriella megaspora]|nr:MAG: Cell morphogenesis protein PAG1 [Bogoriella megaspora]